LGPPTFHSGRLYPVWRALQEFSALTAIYSSGIPALFAHNFQLLAAILMEPTVIDVNDQRIPALERANATMFRSGYVKPLLGPLKDRHTPGSEYLQNMLQELLRSYLPSEDEYVNVFDEFEYFVALVYWHRFASDSAPLGNFVWRRWGMTNSPEDPVLDRFVTQLRANGEEWGLFSAGFFNDLNGLDQAVSGFTEWGFNVAQRLQWGG
jgi:hypothetical protein